MSATIIMYPEGIIRFLLETGIATISGTPTIIDRVLQGQNATDLADLKAYWATNPPAVLTGYARAKTTFPAWAIVLMGDNTGQDYVGMGQMRLNAAEASLLGFDEGDYVGHNRVIGSFGILVYAEHPEVCAMHYRLARYVLNAGRKYLISKNLQEPMISGAEMAPDPRYIPDNLFVRRITLTVEYEEFWDEEATIALTLATPTIPDRVDPDLVDVRVFHEDIDYDGDGVADGGVEPYTPED